jgi:hypothetical protein
MPKIDEDAKCPATTEDRWTKKGDQTTCRNSARWCNGVDHTTPAGYLFRADIRAAK